MMNCVFVCTRSVGVLSGGEVKRIERFAGIGYVSFRDDSVGNGKSQPSSTHFRVCFMSSYQSDYRKPPLGTYYVICTPYSRSI